MSWRQNVHTTISYTGKIQTSHWYHVMGRQNCNNGIFRALNWLVKKCRFILKHIFTLQLQSAFIRFQSIFENFLTSIKSIILLSTAVNWSFSNPYFTPRAPLYDDFPDCTVQSVLSRLYDWTRWIPWLLIAWRRNEPSHQQSCFCPSYPEITWSISTGK